MAVTAASQAHSSDFQLSVNEGILHLNEGGPYSEKTKSWKWFQTKDELL